MPGAVADETIIRLLADASQLFSTFKQVEKEMSKLGKSAGAGSGISANVSKQFAQITRYTSVMGDEMSGTKEKINVLQSAIRGLTNDGSKGSMALANNYKTALGSMQKSLSSLSGKQPIFTQLTDGLKAMGGPAAQAGTMLETISSGAAGLAGTLSIVGVALTVVKAGFDAMILPGIKFNMMLEQQTVAFEVMLKSGSAATELVTDLKKLTMSTGVSLADSMASVKQMLAYGFGGEEMISSLKMLNTVAKAVNVPMTDLTYVYGTLRAQGRAYTRDIMQFAMRGIPIYEYLAKVLEVDVSKLKGLIEEGKVGFPEVEKAFQMMTGEGGKFSGMLEKSMQTTAGLVTQIQNQWQLVTGGMAEASGGPVRIILQSLLEILKHSKLIQFIIGALYYPLMAIVAALTFMLAVINDVWHFYVRVFETIVSGVKAVFDWVMSLGPVKSIMFDIAMAAKAVVGWIAQLNNKLADTKMSAKNIATSIQAWFNGDEKKPFVIDTSTIEVKGGSTAMDAIKSSMAKGNADNTIFADIMSSNWAAAVKRMKGDESLKSLVRGYKITWEEVATVMAKQTKLSEDNLKSFLAATKSTVTESLDYWKFFKNQVNKMTGFFGTLENSIFGEGFGAGEAAASTAVDAYKKQLMSIQKAYSDIGASQLTQTEITKEWKDATVKELETYVSTVISEGKVLSEAEHGFLIVIQNYIDALKTELSSGGVQKAIAKSTDDIFQTFLNFRAKFTTIDTNFLEPKDFAILSSVLGEDLRTASSMVDREGQLIAQKYRQMLDKIMPGDEYTQLKKDLVTVMTLLEQTYLASQRALDLAEKRFDTAETMADKLSNINEIYKRQLELNEQLSDSDEKRLADATALKRKQKELADIYKGQGSQGVADRVSNRLITQGVDQRASGDFIGGMTSTLTGAATGAMGGTELGSMIMGGLGDPITMVAVALMKLIMEIENVQKVLGAFTTIAMGIVTMIGEPLNAALQPVVYMLDKLGEMIGALLLPFIDILAEQLAMLAVPIEFVAQILKMFFMALKPLIKLIMYLANPLLMLGNVLATLLSSMQASIEMEKDQQKEKEDMYAKELATLQNLYEVGALSGEEYQARLAELKRQYATDAEQQTDPILVKLFQDMFAAIAEMGRVLGELFIAFGPVFAFFAGPIVYLLKTALEIVVTYITYIANFLTGLANILTGIMTGNGDLVVKGLKQVMYALAQALMYPFQVLANLIGDLIDWFMGPGDQIAPIVILPNVANFAVGTGNVPTDMAANIHKGEGIIPASFMDSIRSGDLALTSGSMGGRGSVNVYVTVEGSVQAERDLARSIASEVNFLVKKGHA